MNDIEIETTSQEIVEAPPDIRTEMRRFNLEQKEAEGFFALGGVRTLSEG